MLPILQQQHPATPSSSSSSTCSPTPPSERSLAAQQPPAAHSLHPLEHQHQHLPGPSHLSILHPPLSAPTIAMSPLAPPPAPTDSLVSGLSAHLSKLSSAPTSQSSATFSAGSCFRMLIIFIIHTINTIFLTNTNTSSSSSCSTSSQLAHRALHPFQAEYLPLPAGRLSISQSRHFHSATSCPSPRRTPNTSITTTSPSTCTNSSSSSSSSSSSRTFIINTTASFTTTITTTITNTTTTTTISNIPIPTTSSSARLPTPCFLRQQQAHPLAYRSFPPPRGSALPSAGCRLATMVHGTGTIIGGNPGRFRTVDLTATTVSSSPPSSSGVVGVPHQRIALGHAKGLLNGPGQNNCFLNCAVQSLCTECTEGKLG
uniref:Uncharacterized protein n=1 Tax=Anopheles atroparvus TaxID=41427 RepID=A0A182J394_ANOAO